MATPPAPSTSLNLASGGIAAYPYHTTKVSASFSCDAYLCMASLAVLSLCVTERLPTAPDAAALSAIEWSLFWLDSSSFRSI